MTKKGSNKNATEPKDTATPTAAEELTRLMDEKKKGEAELKRLRGLSRDIEQQIVTTQAELFGIMGGIASMKRILPGNE